MRSLIALSAFLVVVYGGLLLTGDGAKHIPALENWMPGAAADQNKVLVFLVNDRAGVDKLRRAVDPSRVVWSTPDAVALEEGRVVTTGVAVVGDIVKQAGWIDREIEIVTVTKQDLVPARSGGGGQNQDVDPERMARLGELMKKPTLSSGEQLLVLKAMNDGVEF